MRFCFWKKEAKTVSGLDTEILSVLIEIRDKLTTREEQDYSAILSGVVSKIGPMKGGKASAEILSGVTRCLIEDMRKK